jgi:hypothetical protein
VRKRRDKLREAIKIDRDLAAEAERPDLDAQTESNGSD